VYLVVSERVSRMTTQRLIAQVSEDDEESRIAHTADALFDIAYHADKLRIPIELPRFSSVRAVNEFHDRVLTMQEEQEERIRRATALRAARLRAVKRGEDVQFPPPPVPGNDTIRPLTRSSDLQKESRLQGNCVKGYSHQVINRQCYIYRVMTPERATLSIVSGSSGSWCISELKLAGNKKASQATRECVNEWLNKYSGSL